jgi:hypothetical protein
MEKRTDNRRGNPPVVALIGLGQAQRRCPYLPLQKSL